MMCLRGSCIKYQFILFHPVNISLSHKFPVNIKCIIIREACKKCLDSECYLQLLLFKKNLFFSQSIDKFKCIVRKLVLSSQKVYIKIIFF